VICESATRTLMVLDTRRPVRTARIDKDELFLLRPNGLLETYRIRSGMRTAWFNTSGGVTSRTPLHAEIERAGLDYSYNAVDIGAVGLVGFVARATLSRSFASRVMR
jgi:hypothetical protein